MAKPSKRIFCDLQRFCFHHIALRACSQPTLSKSNNVSCGFLAGLHHPGRIWSRFHSCEPLSRSPSINAVLSRFLHSNGLNFSRGPLTSRKMSAGFSSDLPNLSSKVKGLRGFIEKGSIYKLISVKSFNSAKIAEGFGKSLISRPLSSIRSMFLRYREVIGLQVEAFWKRNYLFIIGAGGLVLCIVLWRILFGLASIFVGISEGMAKYGFLALATAIVAFTHEMKLLAVDIPMASGPDQRIFLIGHEQEYRVGGGLISELRDPIVKAMAAEKEFEALDLKEEEDDEKKEREEAERKQRDKEQRVLENEKRQRELESLEKDIRQGMSSLRGSSLFPHSIRSTTATATATPT